MQQFTSQDKQRLHAPSSEDERLSEAQGSQRAHLKTLARRLYILAWVIEGVAVSLGLGMALSLNLPGQSTLADFLLGGGGFVMVACAELSKIPLATFFVEAASARAKLATLAFLLLMSFITFETIFMSLERGFNVRMLSVQAQAERIASLKEELSKLRRETENPTADLISTREALQRQLSEIEAARSIETRANEEQRTNLQNQRRASDMPKEIDDQLQAQDAERRFRLEERDRRIASIDARAGQDLHFLNARLEAARRANEAERHAEIRRRIASVNARADKERARTESDYQRQLGELETSRRKLIEERAGIVRGREEATRPQLDELSRQEQRLYLDYTRRRNERGKQIADLHKKEEELLREVGPKRQRLEVAKGQIHEMEIEYRRTAAQSQLHRIASPLAGWWSNKEYEPHTVPERYVRRVAMVWFGSMAALGALGGAVVAMVSQLLMQRAAQIGPPNAPPRSGSGSIARVLFTLTLIRRARRVKTVVKKQREIVAVPVPVSGVSLETLQGTYAALKGPLSELPEPTA